MADKVKQPHVPVGINCTIRYANGAKLTIKTTEVSEQAARDSFEIIKGVFDRTEHAGKERS